MFVITNLIALLNTALVGFLPFFKKGGNFDDFLLAFLHTKPFFKKCSILKGQILLPTRANYFILELIPFRKGSINMLTVTFLEVYLFPLIQNLRKPVSVSQRCDGGHCSCWTGFVCTGLC